jgi:uncharacterized repeat protein (TIGR01451 family)
VITYTFNVFFHNVNIYPAISHERIVAMKKKLTFGQHLTGTRIFYAMMMLVLIFGLASPQAALAQQTSPFTATALTPDSTISIPKNLVVTPAGMTGVIVKLKGDALAGYQGDVAGFAATSPIITGSDTVDVNSKASRDYLGMLEQKHANFKSALSKLPQAKVVHDFQVVTNSVSVVLPVEQVPELAKMPEVEAVYADQLLKIDTDNSPQFIGAPTVWQAEGGQEKAGEGVIVGVIDTGIWPEHPSFSDPDPSGKPYAPAAPAPSGVARKCEFGVGANPGPAFQCNNKLIGAYVFMNTYTSVYPGGDTGGYTSARDDDGHGTHTASTSAGNAGVQASIFGVQRGTISGIAPRAKVIMYRVCGANGCFSSDSMAAAEQAILDGVNVINFSISGGSSPYSDAVEQAFLDAYDAGVFVAASAGNSGPGADTTDHRGPWVTTVAASTQNRAFQDTLTLTAGSNTLTLKGTSLTAGVGPAPVFVPGAADYQCNTPFAAGSVTGKVVVCARGVTGRAQKGWNVLQGGAVGMILYNQSTAVTDLETDNHYLPATHIQYPEGQQVLAFLTANPTATATLTAGVKVAAQGDIMASFSSRGGTGQTLGVSKPDITAPGVQILAGASPAHLTPANGGVALGPEGELFQAIAGTSMSSPHIAGSGALLKALHPKWTPGQIKSALMTTAVTAVLKEDGVTPATPFDDGSGRVNLSKAGDPGLTFDVKKADYVAHAADLWNVNYPSVYIPVMPGIETVKRTAHSTLMMPSVWELSVKGETDFNVIVQKVLFVGPGKDASFDIVIDAKNVPIGQVRTATLFLTEVGQRNARQLHMPITFIRKQPVIPMTKTCTPASIARGAQTTCTVSFTNTTFSAANVEFIDMLPLQLKLVNGSVSGANSFFNTVTYKGSLYGAQPPDVAVVSAPGGSPAGYLPLSLFGIGAVSGVSDESITNFSVPAFMYGGVSYTRIGVVSDGYVVVGGGTSGDVQFLNQKLPDAGVPNNVLAPWWTDMNPGAAGAIRVGTLGDGVNTWIVVDYDGVPQYSTPTKGNSFEVWIRIGTVQDITFTYGTLTGNGDLGLLTVGAENSFGNRGSNYYYNGTGTLPVADAELAVNSVAGTPGETKTITYKATGLFQGKAVNYASLTSNLFQGVSIAPFTVEVTK